MLKRPLSKSLCSAPFGNTGLSTVASLTATAAFLARTPRLLVLDTKYAVSWPMPFILTDVLLKWKTLEKVVILP